MVIYFKGRLMYMVLSTGCLPISPDPNWIERFELPSSQWPSLGSFLHSLFQRVPVDRENRTLVAVGGPLNSLSPLHDFRAGIDPAYTAIAFRLSKQQPFQHPLLPLTFTHSSFRGINSPCYSSLRGQALNLQGCVSVHTKDSKTFRSPWPMEDTRGMRLRCSSQSFRANELYPSAGIESEY
jgi:hypothetical protein